METPFLSRMPQMQLHCPSKGSADSVAKQNVAVCGPLPAGPPGRRATDRRLPLILVRACRDRRRVPLPVSLQCPRPPAGCAMPDHAQSPTCTRPRPAGGRPGAVCTRRGAPTPGRGPSPSRRRTAGRPGTSVHGRGHIADRPPAQAQACRRTARRPFSTCQCQ